MERNTLTPSVELFTLTPAQVDGETAQLLRRQQDLLLELQRVGGQINDRYEEFERRGGWTRGFLVVTNGHGHLHKSRHCTTCFPTTRYSWVTEVSGKSEDEIVALAGERACTICYPDAPVDVLRRPTQLWTPEEIEAKRLRDEKKASRAAEQAEKGITNPDGSPLRIQSHGYASIIRTLVTARNEAGSELVDMLLCENPRYADHWTLAYRDAAIAEHRASAFTLITAIAHKLGRPFSEVYNEFLLKAKAKYKKDYGSCGHLLPLFPPEA